MSMLGRMKELEQLNEWFYRKGIREVVDREYGVEYIVYENVDDSIIAIDGKSMVMREVVENGECLRVHNVLGRVKKKCEMFEDVCKLVVHEKEYISIAKDKVVLVEVTDKGKLIALFWSEQNQNGSITVRNKRIANWKTCMVGKDKMNSVTFAYGSTIILEMVLAYLLFR